MRRHKKASKHEEVELNLAAMLDMAFQLLTFFILTFKPSPVEGQFLLHLPPAQAVTQGQAAIAKVPPTATQNLVKSFNTLVITATADEQGQLKQIRVHDALPANLDALDHLLNEIVGSFGFDQVIIEVDSRLHYDWLMKVIDVCTRQKLPDGSRIAKMSFVEI